LRFPRWPSATRIHRCSDCPTRRQGMPARKHLQPYCNGYNSGPVNGLCADKILRRIEAPRSWRFPRWPSAIRIHHRWQQLPTRRHGMPAREHLQPYCNGYNSGPVNGLCTDKILRRIGAPRSPQKLAQIFKPPFYRYFLVLRFLRTLAPWGTRVQVARERVIRETARQ
jgi:hypothetical protein